MNHAIFTIGFTRKSLRRFVELLREARVERLVDVRLHNTSQLAGFAKMDDLQFICETFGIEYRHCPELAPSADLLYRFKKDKNWQSYECDFHQLLEGRDVRSLWKSQFAEKERVCLLCSEDKPEKCHRRLVAEYLQRLFGTDVRHL